MRILLAPEEIAGQLSTTARALRAAGALATAVTYREHRFAYPADRCLWSTSRRVRRGRVFLHFLGALARYDVFHLDFARSLLRKYRDLPVLAALGKKLVCEFWGSDVRAPARARAMNPASPLGQARSDERVAGDLTALSRRVKTALVADGELFRYVSPYFEKVVVVRQRIDLRGFSPRYPSRDERAPLVVHAPSHRGDKGSETVLQVARVLEDAGRIRFRLIEGLPHAEAMRLLSEADVVVDQLLLGTYGILACEAMALGKPVVTYLHDEFRDRYPDDLPIVSATPATLAEVLGDLAADGSRRETLGRRGRSYVEAHHDAARIAEQLIRIYEAL